MPKNNTLRSNLFAFRTQIKVQLKNKVKPVTVARYKNLFDYHSNIVVHSKQIPSDGYEINEVVKTILNYFYKVPDFDKGKQVVNTPSLSKGILLIGDNGVGKSMLFEIILNMAKEIALVKKNGEMLFMDISAVDFVEQYMKSARTSREASKAFEIELFYNNTLYIDDLGKETKAFSRIELMGQLLFERHRRQTITFVTTNYTLEQIKERYGDHIGDRLPEMFNIIYWRGVSYRD